MSFNNYDIFINIAEFLDYPSLLYYEYVLPKLLLYNRYKILKFHKKRTFNAYLSLFYKNDYVIGTLLLNTLYKIPLKQKLDLYFCDDNSIYFTYDGLRINEIRCYIYKDIFEEIFGLYFKNGLKIIDFRKYITNKYIFNYEIFLEKNFEKYRTLLNKNKNNNYNDKKYINDCISDILKIFKQNGYQIHIEK